MLENRTFDIIDKLKVTKNLTDLKAVFGESVAGFGGNAFMICDVPPNTPPSAKDIHASGWHPNWQEKYIQRGYAKDDPVPNCVGLKADPYYWSEAEQLSIKNVKAAKIMNEARSEFQMQGGYCVPIHGLRGVAGVVSIATDLKNWKLSEHEDAALHMISLYAYEAIRRLSQSDRSDGGCTRLSRRETECLQWIAEGKTTWEIGTILGISEHTAGEYIDIAARKLGTRSRAHLVAKAIRQNFIH